MAGLGVSFDASGTDELLLNLNGISDRAVDLLPLAPTYGLIFQADIDERFDSSPAVRSSGTVYGGVTWEALSDRYLRANPRREGGQQLRDTGALLQSFVIDEPGNIFEATKDGLTFGSALPYASALDKKRPILFYHQELTDQLAAATQIYIVEGF